MVVTMIDIVAVDDGDVAPLIGDIYIVAEKRLVSRKGGARVVDSGIGRGGPVEMIAKNGLWIRSFVEDIRDDRAALQVEGDDPPGLCCDRISVDKFVEPVDRIAEHVDRPGLAIYGKEGEH